MNLDWVEACEWWVGLRVDEIPEAYDADAVETALDAKPSKKSERIPWSEYADVDPNEGDERPDWPGCESQDAALEAGRCGAPMANSVRRFGEIRYCTRLPMRRMGQANWEEGSDFCSHHEHLERKALPAYEIFDLFPDEPLPYDTWF